MTLDEQQCILELSSRRSHVCMCVRVNACM